MRDMNQFGDIVKDLLDHNELEVTHNAGEDVVHMITGHGTVDVYFKSGDIADQFWSRWLKCITTDNQAYLLCKAIFAENINIYKHFADCLCVTCSEMV